jgi:hypothetical protein
MAYEVFDQKAARLGSPALTIATDGRLALNSDAGDLMKGLGATFVHLLWDPEARKIALRPLVKSDSRSYRLSVPHAHKRGMLVSASTFLRYIGWPLSRRVTLPARWNEKERILEAVLPVVAASTKGASETRNETLRAPKGREK